VSHVVSWQLMTDGWGRGAPHLSRADVGGGVWGLQDLCGKPKQGRNGGEGGARSVPSERGRHGPADTR
jgi:hypothetical protein